MFRNLFVPCTWLALGCAALSSPAAAQVAERQPSRPWLVAFETPDGYRIRLDSQAPHAKALLLTGSPEGRLLATQPLQLDADGDWTLDLGPSEALARDGLELRVVVAQSGAGFDAVPGEGHSGAHWSNSLTVGSAAILAGPNGGSGQRGDLVITEFMKDPSAVGDSDGEWVELVNPGPISVQLAGWMLHDGGSNAHVIQAQGPFLIVTPGTRLVLGNEDDASLNGGVSVDYEYSSFTLSNGADEIFLTARNGDLIDAVSYDDGALWPDLPGMSISLNPAIEHAVLNDDPLAWCQSGTLISPTSTDTGTPGGANDLCP